MTWTRGWSILLFTGLQRSKLVTSLKLSTRVCNGLYWCILVYNVLYFSLLIYTVYPGPYWSTDQYWSIQISIWTAMVYTGLSVLNWSIYWFILIYTGIDFTGVTGLHLCVPSVLDHTGLYMVWTDLYTGLYWSVLHYSGINWSLSEEQTGAAYIRSNSNCSLYHSVDRAHIPGGQETDRHTHRTWHGGSQWELFRLPGRA